MAADATPAKSIQLDIGATAPNARGLQRDAVRERLTLLCLSAPAFILVLITMVAPVTWLFWLSFLADDGGFSLEHYKRMIEQPSYGRTFLTTFNVSLLTTGICVVLGYPLAYVLSQLPQRVANLCLIAVLLPFWTSLLVRTYAWLALLQRKGLINNWGIGLGLWDEPLALVHNLMGTLIGMVHIMLPFLVLPVLGAMRAIDRDYLKAAANLGAGPVRAFWLVFFPLSMPGLLAGALIVFILCLGFYVTPALLGSPAETMISQTIMIEASENFDYERASAAGALLLLITIAIVTVYNRYFGLERLWGGSER